MDRAQPRNIDLKPKHRGGYTAEHTDFCERTLVTLLRGLGPWKEGVYLAGGLVPRYLISQANDVPPHAGTTDVDLVLNFEILAEIEAYRRLEVNLKALGFERGTNDDGRRQNFRWVKDVGGGITVIVDLLCEAPVEHGTRVTSLPGESQLSALGIRGAHLIARDFVEVPITAELLDDRGIATEIVRVAGLVPFLVLKALAYQDRFEQKDAYDIVYCLQYYGKGPDDAAALFADRMARWPDELLLPQALDILRDRFASDGSTEGHRKDGPVSYAGFLVDAGRTTLNMQRRRDAAVVVERFLQGFGGLGLSLPLRKEEERSTEREHAAQVRGDGRILNFRVSSLGQSDATVEWGTNASMEVRVSLFRSGSNTPQQTTRITSVGLPGREQTVRFLNLDPGVSYRAVAQCEDDRQELGFKTHEASMR